MKKALRVALATLIIAGATILAAGQWASTPGAFPPLPGWLVEWCLRRYDPQNAEEMRDLELLLGVAIWAPLITAGYALAVCLGRSLVRSKR